MDLFERLREERTRLGLTQQDVADVAAVHVKTVRRWESQIPIPMNAMEPLIAIGYDVQYVVTGLRSKNIAQVRDKGVDYQLAPVLSKEELELLRHFRAMNATQRGQLQAMVGVLALGTPRPRATRKVTAVRKKPAATASKNSSAVRRRVRAKS